MIPVLVFSVVLVCNGDPLTFALQYKASRAASSESNPHCLTTYSGTKGAAANNMAWKRVRENCPLYSSGREYMRQNSGSSRIGRLGWM
jgi:hypothetical protein